MINVQVANVKLTRRKKWTVVNEPVASFKQTGEDGIYSQYGHRTQT